MSANDLWNGWASVGGIAATLSGGVVSCVDAGTAAGQNAKYQREVRAKGGDVVEFSTVARAVSGTGHLYCDLTTAGNTLAAVSVTGHTDWRRYTLRCVVPLDQTDCLLLVGVSTYDAEVGELQAKLPSLRINGVPVLPGATKNGLRQRAQNEIGLMTNDAERVVISDTGRVRIGGVGNNDPIAAGSQGATFNDGELGRLKIYTSGTSAALFSRDAPDTAARDLVGFYAVSGVGGTNSKVGSITITNAATAYNTSSDYRLKTNVEPLRDALATLKALEPVTYNWRVEEPGAPKTMGFIAHVLQAVVPQAVTGSKDAVDADGAPEYQGVDASKLVPLLTAAVQELAARVAELEAK